MLTRPILAALAVTAIVVFVAAGPVGAQVFYQYPEAPVVTDSQPAAGGIFGVGENSLLRFLGYGRFDINRSFDLGLELVLDNQDTFTSSSWRFGVGADAKYSIRPDSTVLPFDLSALAGFGFQSGGDLTNFDFPVAGVISRALELENGRRVVPYGGVYVIIRHASFSPQGLPSSSNTDVDLELRLGTSVELWEAGDAFLAVHLAEQFLFTVGFNARM
jgi:hypothetical protein